MTTRPSRTLDAQVALATQRVVQLKARQMVREFRTIARLKAREKRAKERRLLDLGGTVIAAGVGDWEDEELLGLLLDGRDRALGSATLRLAMRKRGRGVLKPSPDEEAHVARAPAARIPLDSPKEQASS